MQKNEETSCDVAGASAGSLKPSLVQIRQFAFRQQNGIKMELPC
jgi:hypothetical protein